MNSEGAEELAEEYIKADEARGTKYEFDMRKERKAGLCSSPKTSVDGGEKLV